MWDMTSNLLFTPDLFLSELEKEEGASVGEEGKGESLKHFPFAPLVIFLAKILRQSIWKMMVLSSFLVS